MNKNNEVWFEKRLIRRFFLPALLSSLGLAIGAIADSIYIGNTLNESGLFILEVASPVYLIFSTIALGVSEGGAIHFAAAQSKGNKEEANRVALGTIFLDFACIALLCILGLIFVKPLLHLLGATPELADWTELLSYVRLMLLTAPILFLQAPLQYFVHTDGNPKLASAAMVAGTLGDCCTGFLLIVVLHKGVLGSIWATVVGALLMECICLGHFIRKKGSLELKIVKPDVRGFVKDFSTGFSMASTYLYQFVIILLFNRILLGLMGEGGVAIFGVIINVGSLVVAVIDAVVMVIIPLVSTFYGERNRDGVLRSTRLSMQLCLECTAVAVLLLCIFAGPVCRAFGISEQFLTEGSFALRAYLPALLVSGINVLGAAFCQNVEREKLSYVLTILRGIGILLPAGLVLSLFGGRAFWFAYLLTELLVLLLVIGYALWSRREDTRDFLDFPGEIVFSENLEGRTELISDMCERIQLFLEEIGSDNKTAYFITLAVDEVCRMIADNGSGKLMLQLTLVCVGKEPVAKAAEAAGVSEGQTDDASLGKAAKAVEAVGDSAEGKSAKEREEVPGRSKGVPAEIDKYILHIRDNASRFNPFEVDEESDAGLGLKLIRKQATDFHYREFVGFNTLSIEFRKAEKKKPKRKMTIEELEAML